MQIIFCKAYHALYNPMALQHWKKRKILSGIEYMKILVLSGSCSHVHACTLDAQGQLGGVSQSLLDRTVGSELKP